MKKLSELIRTPTLMNTIYTAETFSQTVPHAHPGVELVYNVSGHIDMDFYPKTDSIPPAKQGLQRATRVTISSGQFMLIDSYVPHLQYVNERVHMLILELDTCLKNILPKKFLASSDFAENCAPIANLCKSLNDVLIFADDSNVCSILSKTLLLLYNNYHGKHDDYFEIDLELSLKRLIIEICKSRKLTFLGKKHNIYVAKALSLLDSHYNETDLSEQIGTMTGISLHQLNIYLKQAFGQSFSKLLADKRLDSAKSLLKATNYSIGSVAKQVGFGSLRRFESAFKQKFGITPKKYRQNYEEQGFVFWTDSENVAHVAEDFRIQLQ